MDASLSTIQGLDYHLKLPLPKAPVWALDTARFSGHIQFCYPVKNQSPKIEMHIKELLDQALLAELASEPKRGFFPPYGFTLVAAQESFKDKKHTECQHPWSKPEWTWAAEFTARRFDWKKGKYRSTTQRIDDPLKMKSQKARTSSMDMIMLALKTRNALSDLRDALWIEWQALLAKNDALYQNFFKYCGLSYLLQMEKQRQKLESQMVDAYEAWTRNYPGGMR